MAQIICYEIWPAQNYLRGHFCCFPFAVNTGHNLSGRKTQVKLIIS